MPDYMLVFAVPILAHLPEFTAYDDHEGLTMVREALYFVMDPLISKNENFSFNFSRCAAQIQRWQKRNVNCVKQQLPGLACCC